MSKSNIKEKHKDNFKQNKSNNNDEEEYTYNNLESIEALMKTVKQEEKSEQYSDDQNSENEEQNLEGESDPEIKKESVEIKNKTITKKKAYEDDEYSINEESEDDDYDGKEEDDEEEFDEESETSKKKFTKKKRNRSNSKKPKSKQKKKNKKGKGGVEKFFEFEAESDEEEESEIDEGEVSKKEQEKIRKQLYDMRDQTASTSRKRLDIFEKSEEELRKRYEEMEEEEGFNENHYEEGDMIGQQGRQPSISDPKLWLIKCRPGKEKESVEYLYHKYFAFNKVDDKLKILSASCFDSLKGYIYVEAFKEANVREAIQGISLLKENSIKIVPLTEMTQVFEYDKIQKINIKPKQWVRIKTGLYEGDLAQVFHVEDPINKIYILLVPRISELSSTSNKKENEIITDAKKAKKSVRPRQKLFNPKNLEDVLSKNHPIIREEVYTWNKMSFMKGFLIKSVKAKSLITEDVVPKIEELRLFDLALSKAEDGEVKMDIDNLINAIQETEISKKKNFSKGDKIKVIRGGLKGISGKIVSHNDGLVQMICDIEGVSDVIELPEDYIAKDFLPGDLVKVVNGPHIGKRGLIVKVEDDTAHIFSEYTMSEFKVSCQDIVSSTHQLNEIQQDSYYQLGDLVKINGTNAIGFILDVQKYSIKIIDTRTEIKNINIREVTKLTQIKPNGIDSKRNPITKDDTVKISSGPYKGKKGVIRNIFRNHVFLYNQDFVSTNGIFVDKTEHIEIMGSELLTDYNMTNGKVNMRKIPEEIRKLIGQTVRIIKGNWKGYIGILKKANDKNASVELSSKNKIITVDLSSINSADTQANTNKMDNINATPRSNIRTPAYYPQSPAYNTTSPRFNPTTTPTYWNSPNPRREGFSSPGNNYK